MLEDVSVEIAPNVYVTFQKVQDPCGFLFEGKFISADVLHLKLIKKQLEMYELGKISAVDFYTVAIERSYVDGAAWEQLKIDASEIGRERHSETEKLLAKINDIKRREEAKIEKSYASKMKELNKKYVKVHIEPEVLSVV